jgi:hypothetical protein
MFMAKIQNCPAALYRDQRAQSKGRLPNAHTSLPRNARALGKHALTIHAESVTPPLGLSSCFSGN